MPDERHIHQVIPDGWHIHQVSTVTANPAKDLIVLEVQQLLTAVGAHRSAGPVDLLIAATAERERLTVLCDDHDYLTIATVTSQPVKLVTDI